MAMFLKPFSGFFVPGRATFAHKDEDGLNLAQKRITKWKVELCGGESRGFPRRGRTSNREGMNGYRQWRR